MSAARPGKNFSEMKCPAPGSRNLIKNGEFVESYLGSVGGTFLKSRHRGAGRGAVTASPGYETTDVPMWPRPKTLFPSEKSRRWVEISDGFSIRTL
jgi:hypothetical protein